MSAGGWQPTGAGSPQRASGKEPVPPHPSGQDPEIGRAHV